MVSTNEIAVSEFCGKDNTGRARQSNGQFVLRRDVTGSGLAVETVNRVQVFFIFIGRDADIEIGRILAEATGAEFQGAADEDLAKVLAEFSKYL